MSMLSKRMPRLEEVLPHRKPMILLGAILSYQPPEIRCGVTIREDSMFIEYQTVPAIVSLEYMAQCAAAYSGMQKRERGEATRVGYLLGTRSIELKVDRLACGDELEVVAHHRWGGKALASFDCQVVGPGCELVAIATISVYEGVISH